MKFDIYGLKGCPDPRGYIFKAEYKYLGKFKSMYEHVGRFETAGGMFRRLSPHSPGYNDVPPNKRCCLMKLDHWRIDAQAVMSGDYIDHDSGQAAPIKRIWRKELDRYIKLPDSHYRALRRLAATGIR